MRSVEVHSVKEAVKQACREMAFVCSPDIIARLEEGRKQETGVRSRIAMDTLLENARIAKEENIPICQDTGMVTVYVHMGQDVVFTGGSLKQAVLDGVAESYTENGLRASVVDDPVFERKNTKTNTPAVIYFDVTDGEEVRIELTAKGFGSENMSRIAMLKPAQGVEGIREFVLETIRMAGPNACPPMIVGVGIGGTFDACAVLSKRALLRGVNDAHPDPRYAALEEELYEAANELGIGPMGLHGKTTVLSVKIETMPTHIAGMPCAVNICCHACRHREVIL